VTPLSRVVYTHFHPEDLDLSVAPWGERAIRAGEAKLAFEGNQALPFLIFGRHVEETRRRVPTLRLRTLERFSFGVYLLSGGFRGPGLLPAAMVGPLLRLERLTAPLWRGWGALRALLVVERVGE
jgi:hypothetical protein